MKDKRHIYHLMDFDEPKWDNAEVGYIKTILSEKEFEKVIAVYKRNNPEDYCFDDFFISWLNKNYQAQAEIIEVTNIHF